MTKALFWADSYIKKRCSAKEAISRIKPGQRIFISSFCGEPQHLIRELSKLAGNFTDLEIVRLLCLESIPLTLIADKSHSRQFTIRSFYLGSAKPKMLSKNVRFITPVNLSQIPKLFKSKRLPLNAALIQVSPPDDFGWMSLGISVDITKAAAESADLVIAQVNPRMPRVLGRSFIHVNDVNCLVEHEEELLTIGEPPEIETDTIIARYISRLIDDGATLQTHLGSAARATLLCLAQKNDIGIHTQYLTDGIMRLVSMGVITNKKKGFNQGKLVAASGIGSSAFYEFLNDNPAIEFYPSDYINNPGIISRHNAMVSMNTATKIDLTGQVAADAVPFNTFTGVNGMLDFIRGSTMAPGGKSILILTSTSTGGKKSRIVPCLTKTAIVVPRGDVQYVVTEFGVVNLFGKNIQERALALISIAHPDFRDELFNRAKALKLIDSERQFKKTLKSIYPLNLETQITRNNIAITVRPARAMDERAIQEHFYAMEQRDVASRFLSGKASFGHDQVENTVEIDYINDLTLVAEVGEIGFGTIIAVGEYMRNPSNNMAEVAFSVSEGYKAMGIGKVLQQRLAEAAKKNGIKGLVAYTSLGNQGMIRLFHKLPYKVRSKYDDGMLILSCRFSEPVKEKTIKT